MKIDISTIDTDSFVVRPVKIADEICYLVFPKEIGCKWNQGNLIFRSSVWNSNGELISASYKKFFNWGEQPDLITHPSDNDKLECLEKIDGSTLIVSKYNGEIIARTRGTADATVLEKNGFEIGLLKEKYPKAFEFDCDTSSYTRIFEWTTPLNIIILNYGEEPELWYTGKIYHDRYVYAKQNELDSEYASLGVKRPKRYNFDNITNMIDTVQAFKGVEGICVYFNNGQDIRKLKGLDYLAKHRFKSSASFENTLDLFVEWERPEFMVFQQKLIETFDYECYEMVRGYASQICDATKQMYEVFDGMKRLIDKVHGLSRKEQALAIQQAYGKTSRCGYAFSMLDNKPLDKNAYKKLIYQIVGR